ncbi:hypothetical protein J6590_047126 [Homalodisca vitripennis]|nr:hypothetical protein J6590_047126 [Homalodisca vitripennis]
MRICTLVPAQCRSCTVRMRNMHLDIGAVPIMVRSNHVASVNGLQHGQLTHLHPGICAVPIMMRSNHVASVTGFQHGQFAHLHPGICAVPIMMRSNHVGSVTGQSARPVCAPAPWYLRSADHGAQ